jgi:BRCT domain type II-containing protein
MPAAAKPTTHAAAPETTTHAAASAHAASSETAMHTSAEAGPAAEGVLVCHAAVVESAECAGVAAPLHVRRSEATIGSMVEVASEIVATSEIVVMVEKGMAP